jgi:hypothetical protein
MLRKLALLPGIVLLAGVLSSCGGGRGRGYYYRVPPPPVAPRGYYGAAPGPGYVYLDGHHRWTGRAWRWQPGRWARPPRAGAVWVPGSYYQRQGRHHWREGYWR